jgi:hypothetical protein
MSPSPEPADFAALANCAETLEARARKLDQDAERLGGRIAQVMLAKADALRERAGQIRNFLHRKATLP